MNKRNYELTLNVTTGKIKIPSINIYNTDKGIFNIKLFLEKGEGKNIAKLTHDEIVNYKALFQAVKSKTKNYVELEGVLDETENFFYYDLGSKFNDQVGVYNCQIFITDTKGTNNNTTDDEVVTSVPFNYTVTASILTGLNAEITANPDLPVLKELINECKILMNLDSADMSVLDPFQKKEDNAIDGADKNIISNINSINSQIKEKANQLGIIAADINSKNIVDIENNAYDFIPNAKTYLEIPTPDGTHQSVHPKVLYFKNGWNGYKFWMAHTPYTFADDALENPCIAVSNDGENWIEPIGITNPIEQKPSETGAYNSDVHIFMKGDVMECWWRAVINNESIIRRKTSSNGVDWSNTETLFTRGTLDILSPSIIYENDKYKMWYVSNVNGAYEILYEESFDGKIWFDTRILNIEYTYEKNSNTAWHLDVIKFNGKIEIVVNVSPEGTLHYTTSYDNQVFSKAVKILRPRFYNSSFFDSKGIYRSSLVKVENEYYLYYTGVMNDLSHWIALSKGKTIDRLGSITQKNENLKAPDNFFKNNDNIDKFAQNTITFCKITYTNASGFPDDKAGQLITDNSIPEYGRQKQEYRLYDSDIYYIRRTKEDGTWTDWVKNTNDVQYIANTVSPTTPISDYPSNKISYHIISSTWGNTNLFPEWGGGLLETYNIKSDEKGWQRQLFTCYNSKNQYVRFVKSDGTWTNFEIIPKLWSGLTSDRPTGALRIVGMCYFDHNLLKPIWWDGTNWRDAIGNIV